MLLFGGGQNYTLSWISHKYVWHIKYADMKVILWYCICPNRTLSHLHNKSALLSNDDLYRPTTNGTDKNIRTWMLPRTSPAPSRQVHSTVRLRSMNTKQSLLAPGSRAHSLFSITLWRLRWRILHTKQFNNNKKTPRCQVLEWQCQHMIWMTQGAVSCSIQVSLQHFNSYSSYSCAFSLGIATQEFVNATWNAAAFPSKDNLTS